MRIAFFGSSRFSCCVLDALHTSSHPVACVVTQPDMPAGRSMRLKPTPLGELAQSLGLAVLKPPKLRGNAEFEEELASFAPQALLAASYGQLIPRAILKLTPWPLNVHPSLLPRLRGASPIRTALLDGLGVTGCCIMRMTPRLDDGDLLICEELVVSPECNYAGLEAQLGELGGRLAVRALDLAAAGQAVLTPQDHAAATYCREYRREDAQIDWSRPAGALRDFIRAWDPDIGAWTTLPDGRRLKVWRTRIQDFTGRPAQLQAAPGTVTMSHQRLVIACGEGALDLIEVQPESKRRMSAAEFLAGHPLPHGARLGAGTTGSSEKT